MAYQLVSEVLDHAPAELTAAERLVLVALAERMPRRTEWDWKSSHLMRRTGLDARGLRAAVQRLAKRGIDIRVPIGKGKDGRPLYAVPGQQPRWRLPEFPVPDGCTCESCEKQQTEEGGTTIPPTNGGGITVPAGGTRTPPGGTTAPPGGTTAPAAGTTVPPTPSVPQDGDGVGAGGAAASNAAPPRVHEEHNPHWSTQPAFGTPRDPQDAERARRGAAQARAAIHPPDRPQRRRDAFAALIAAVDRGDNGHDT